MVRFRRWIARLLKIGVSDLPMSEVPTQPNKVRNQLSELIRQEVADQLQKAIAEQILPEIKGALQRECAEQSQVKLVRDLEEPDQYAQDINLSDEIDADLPVEQVIGDTQQEQTFETLKPANKSSVELVEESISVFESPVEEMLSFTPFDKEPIRLGIDFGTTTTAVSIKIGDNIPIAAKIGRGGQLYMPSIVWIRPGKESLKERAIIGEDAENQGLPQEIIRSVKRCLGCNQEKCTKGPQGSFPGCLSDRFLRVAGDLIDPKEIVKLIVEEAMSRAISFARQDLKIDITQENIILAPVNWGCGARFDLVQRKILMQAAQELNLSNFSLENVIEEPILAGYSFARFEENPYGRTLIYDFGGGTFDTAILDIQRIDNNISITVVASDGNNALGGDDIDQLIYDFFLEQHAKYLQQSMGNVKKQLNSLEHSNLRQLARQAKEQLSSRIEYSDVLPTEAFGFIYLDLNRDQFEELLKTSGSVKKSLDAVLLACKLAYAFEVGKTRVLLDYPKISQLTLHDAAQYIDHVVLVGGITKIPFVRAQLEQIFGKEKLITEQVIEPISAVAIGAAYERQPQNYSISVPPFGFRLEYIDPVTGSEKQEQLLAPYAYINFHRAYPTSSLPTFNLALPFWAPGDYQNAKITFGREGQDKWEVLDQVNLRDGGNWNFQVEMSGEIYMQPVGEARIKKGDFPLLHPLQTEIRRAREEKRAKEEEERRKRTDDNKITMATEK